MRDTNQITGKVVNPGLVEHLDVKNVKKYIGCDNIRFEKLKTISPFSIARLSARKADSIWLGTCAVYEDIGKDLATLQVGHLNVQGLDLNLQDVVELLGSKTITDIRLPTTFLLDIDKEGLKIIQEAFEKFSGEVEWSRSSAEVSALEITSSKFLYSIDTSFYASFTSTGSYDRKSGTYMSTIQVMNLVGKYPKVSTEVLSQALVLGTLFNIDGEHPSPNGRRAVLSVNINNDNNGNDVRRAIRIMEHVEELVETHTSALDDWKFKDADVRATPVEKLNEFFKAKSCKLDIDLYINKDTIDQSTFEELTNRKLRKLSADSESCDTTMFGKKFDVLHPDDAYLNLSEILLKEPEEGKESQAQRIGKIIKMAFHVRRLHVLTDPFEISISEKSDEISYASFMPILEAIDAINEEYKATGMKTSAGMAKLFRIRLPSNLSINNKLIKSIKDFVKANRTSKERFAEQAICTGNNSVMPLEHNYNTYSIDLYA